MEKIPLQNKQKKREKSRIIEKKSRIINERMIMLIKRKTMIQR